MLWYGMALCVYDSSGDGGETGEDQEVVHQNKQPSLRGVPNSNGCKYEQNALSQALIRFCIFYIVNFMMCR